MNWRNIVGTVAPWLGTALGGPLGGMAGKVIGEVLLPDHPDSTEEQIEQAVMKASPADLQKLKEADQKFKIEMKKLGLDEKRLAADDRANARSREIQVGGWSNPLMAGVVIFGFFGTVGYALAGGLSLGGEAGALIGTLIGYVSAKADQVVSYYFGSSAGQDRQIDRG